MTLYKYPRTYHLPSSPGLQNDDRRLPSLAPFKGKRVIITEKIDGEGATITRHLTHPRSPDARYHPSRDWIKSFQGTVGYMIPEGWRISGEYGYATHSIEYRRKTGNALPSFFLGFGIWNEENILLSWDDTLKRFAEIGITPVKVLYDGIYDEAIVDEIANSIDTGLQEGFVMRLAEEMPYPSGKGPSGRFFYGLAKWVRSGHVQTDEHWMSKPVVPNELLEGISSHPFQ